MANIDDIVAADLAATAMQTTDTVSPAETITYKVGGTGDGEAATAVVIERYFDWDQDDRGKDQIERLTLLLTAAAVADPDEGVDTLLLGSDAFRVNSKTKAGGAWRLDCSRTVRQTRDYGNLRTR